MQFPEHKEPRKRRSLYTQTMIDDDGIPFTVKEWVDVEDWWLNGRWEETYPSEASRKIEAAIEKLRPRMVSSVHPKVG